MRAGVQMGSQQRRRTPAWLLSWVLTWARASLALPLQAKPEATITSSKLTAALWGNYLDPSTPTPDARKRWIAGARELLG